MLDVDARRREGGDGLRAWKESAQGRTYYLYDGTLPVVELDAAGAVAAANTFGGAAPVSRRSGTQSSFYLFDPQGSVAQRTDAAGAVVSSHLFDAHGGELTTTNADPFGYKAQWGYYTDRETGLQLLTYRYYAPQSGRFLTRDPISYRGGINLYGYTMNNLVNSHCSLLTYYCDQCLRGLAHDSGRCRACLPSIYPARTSIVNRPRIGIRF